MANYVCMPGLKPEIRLLQQNKIWTNISSATAFQKNFGKNSESEMKIAMKKFLKNLSLGIDFKLLVPLFMDKINTYNICKWCVRLDCDPHWRLLIANYVCIWDQQWVFKIYKYVRIILIISDTYFISWKPSAHIQCLKYINNTYVVVDYDFP